MATDPNSLLMPKVPGAGASGSTTNPPATPGFDSTSSGDLFARLPAAMASATTQVQKTGDDLGTTLAAEGEKQKALSAQKVQLLTNVATARGTVLDAMQAQDQALTDQAAPVFARAAAIQARRQQVATMNPFKRAVLGFVNRNYNDEHLQHLEDVNNDGLAEIGHVYSLNEQLRGGILNALTSKATDQANVLDAMTDSSNTNIRVASAALSFARDRLHDVGAEIAGDSDVMQAQAQQQNVALQGLTTATASKAEADAASHGGFTTIGGARLSLGQVKSRRQELQGQDLELATRELGLKAQQMNVAEAAERRAIDHMSSADIDSAINSGGMYRGHQLSMSALADAARSKKQISAMGVDNANQANAAGMFTGSVDQFVNNGQTVLGRASALFGNRPPQTVTQFYGDHSRRINDLSTAIRNATDPEQKRILMAQAAQEVQGWTAEQDKMIDGLTAKYSRGAESQKLIGNYLKGDYTDSTTASYGLAQLADGGGMPPGIKPGTAEAQAWQQTVSAVAKAKANGVAAKKPQKQILDDMAQAAGSTYGNYMTNSHTASFISALPAFARSQGHPFGQVSDSDFTASQHAGDVNGLAQLAKQYGFSTQQFQQLMRGSHQGAAQQDAAFYKSHGLNKDGSVKDGYAPDQLAGQLYKMQNQQFLAALDSSPSAKPGFRPSAALADLTRNGSFQAKAGQVLDQRNNSFGSYLGDMTTGGATRGRLSNYANNIAIQADANHAQSIQDHQAMLQNYQNDPVKRAAAILAGIGTDQHTRQILLSQMHNVASSAPPGTSSVDAIDNFIAGAGGKFQDPRLEAERRKIASQWMEASRRTDAQVSAMQQGYVSAAAFAPGD